MFVERNVLLSMIRINKQLERVKQEVKAQKEEDPVRRRKTEHERSLRHPEESLRRGKLIKPFAETLSEESVRKTKIVTSSTLVHVGTG